VHQPPEKNATAERFLRIAGMSDFAIPGCLKVQITDREFAGGVRVPETSLIAEAITVERYGEGLGLVGSAASVHGRLMMPRSSGATFENHWGPRVSRPEPCGAATSSATR
jgi:hypothetical protein